MILKEPISITNFAYNALFTDSARNAWKHLLEYFSIKTPYKVLLPSYIGFTDREGSGVFDPVLETNTPYDFYELDESLSFNLDVIEDIFKEGNIKIFLVIHYFGFCLVNMITLKELCEKYEVILVEDCAHVFSYNVDHIKLGNFGDFSFYSIHKFFPTRTGGILKINNLKYSLSQIPENEHVSYNVLCQLLNSRIHAIQQIRRENYHYLFSLLKGTDEIIFMYDLDDYTFPHSFPIMIKTISREKLYFNLMNKGFPTTALYYRLIHQIDRTKFPISYHISNNILNLPIHQDTTRSDIDKLVNQIHLEISDLKKEII